MNTTNQSAATVPALLLPVIAALAALPTRATFEQTPQGLAFASLDAKTKETLAAIINASRSQWEKDNLANPFEEIEIACAHLLAASVPAADLGKSVESIRSRFYALNGLTALTEKDCAAAILAGKGAEFDALASVFARCKLAKESVSIAEGVRLARLSPSSYAAVNKWLALGVMIERVNEDGKKTEHSVDSLLAPAARKWAKTANLELVPVPSAKK